MAKDQDETIDSENDTVDETEDTDTDEVDETEDSDTDNNDDDADSSADDDDSDDPEVLKEKLRKSQEHSQRMFERAKTAEGFVKKKDPETGKTIWVKKSKSDSKSADTGSKNKSNQTPSDTSNTEGVSPEDLLRETKGYDDDAIATLKKIAAVSNTSLFKAQSDPLFKAYLEKQTEEKKKADAKMGASKGSGKGGQKKTFNTPGLSDDEHKAKWKEKNGR
jgi:hypothetical protein